MQNTGKFYGKCNAFKTIDHFTEFGARMCFEGSRGHVLVILQLVSSVHQQHHHPLCLTHALDYSINNCSVILNRKNPLIEILVVWHYLYWLG